MELQVLLMACGVGVAGMAVLLLIGLFSVSGTSYEEAIAQQRKATTELLALVDSKNKNKKNAKKANKKLAKKEKIKDIVTAGNASEPESEANAESGVDEEPAPTNKPHVDFSPDVVVEGPKDSPANVKIRKRSKDAKVKPILLNKEDPSCVNDPNTPLPDVSNHFEEMQPKDDFELLHSSLLGGKVPEKKEEVIEKKEVKPLKQAKTAKSSPKIAVPAPAADKDEGSRERHYSGDAPKEQRKGHSAAAAKKPDGRKKSISEESSEPALVEAVPPLAAIQPSELTTDKLLRQALAAAAPPAPTPSPPAKGKKKKNEAPTIASVIAAGESGVLNVNELVRVIREASMSRGDIQILTDALLNMHHDLLPEHSEWSEGPNDPMQKLKKQLADKEKALADEIEASQAIHAKLKELRATLNTERSRAAAAASAARAELHTQAARLNRLLEENRQLQQDNMLLQSKLSSEAEAQQAQREHMEMHIQRLSESEAGLLQQLTALQAELSARVVELGQARCEAGAARDSMMQHASDAAIQLQEATRACAELEAARAAAALAEQRAQHELRHAQDRLNGMSELQNEVQRLTSRLQVAESNAEKSKEAADKYKEELDKLQQKVESETSQLQQQLSAREAELAELRALRAAPAHNGLPPSDAIKASELAKVESVVESLRGELTVAQSDCREQKAQIQLLAEQLAQTKDKNNELRTKNWKVMEALQSAEKALSAKAAQPAQGSLTEALTKAQEVHYVEIASVLREACPAAAPGSAPDRAWLRAFADNLKKQLNTPQLKEIVKIERVADEKRVAELQAQNEHLQALANKYKKIIDDTEGVLSRLQSDVGSQEEKWQLQLSEKQRELDLLRQRTEQDPLAFAYQCIEKSLPAIVEQMQGKINELEVELQKVQSTSHNYSFADAERSTQEKLMSVSNGPSQVGIDEK